MFALITFAIRLKGNYLLPGCKLSKRWDLIFFYKKIKKIGCFFWDKFSKIIIDIRQRKEDEVELWEGDSKPYTTRRRAP